jgi:hypothetical protein
MRYAGTAQYRAEYLSWTQPGQEWYAHMSATIFHVLSANFQCLSGARKGERGKDNAEARGTLRGAEVAGRGVWSGKSGDVESALQTKEENSGTDAGKEFTAEFTEGTEDTEGECHTVRCIFDDFSRHKVQVPRSTRAAPSY